MLNKELSEEIQEDVVLDTLGIVSNLQELAKDVLMETLDEANATVMEKCFANNLIYNYLNILKSLIDEEYEIDEVECCKCCVSYEN